MEKPISSEVDLEIDVKEGKVVLAVKYDGKGADAKVEVALEGEYFLDKLAKAIPGEIDDLVIAALKGALK
jgi:hypothetical protein